MTISAVWDEKRIGRGRRPSEQGRPTAFGFAQRGFDRTKVQSSHSTDSIQSFPTLLLTADAPHGALVRQSLVRRHASCDMTQSDRLAHGLSALAAGMDDYAAMPTQPQMLLPAIERALSGLASR